MRLSQQIKSSKLLYEIYFWQAAVQDCGTKRLVLRRITGSHHIYEKPEIDQILSIPVHRSEDLKIGTLRALMKIAQLSEEDLLSARLYPFKRRKPDHQSSAQALHGGFLPFRSMTLTWKKYNAIKTGARQPSHQ